MNRKIIAVLLLTGSMILSFWGLLCVENIAQSLSAQIEEIRTHAEEKNSDTYALCTDAKENWEKEKALLCLYVNHEHFDAIDESFGCLPYMAQTGAYDLLAQSCTSLLCKIEHLQQAEEIRWQNIL